MPKEYTNIFQTADGSLTCFNPESGEYYHNRAGAYTESRVCYVEPSHAIRTLQNTGQLKVLDACYGLGYNSWVLINELLKSAPAHFTIDITAIERDEETLAFLPHVLNFPDFDTLKSKTAPLEHNTYYRTLMDAHQLTILVGETGRISIRMIVDDLRVSLPDISGDFDLIFHDPFSPQKAPELWSLEIFKKYHALLQARAGRILTYSAAGAVRGGLQAAGFAVGKTPGVGYKAGGTIAGFAPELQNSLSPEEVAFLSTKAGMPYEDPAMSSSRASVFARREEAQAQSNRPSAASFRAFLNRDR